MSRSQEKIKNYYIRVTDQLNNKISYLENISRKYSWARLSVFITGTILFLLFYISSYKMTAFYVGLFWGVIFVVLMIYHSKVENSIKRFRLYFKIKNENLARLNIDWNNIPFNEELNKINPKAIEQDLNIIERNGLLHLVSTGIFPESINLLRKWLSGYEHTIEEITYRQKIISELKKLTRFRERLSLISQLSFSGEKLTIGIKEWLKDEKEKKGLNLFTIFLVLLGLSNLLSLFGYLTGYFENYYYQLLLIYLFVYYVGFNYIKDIKATSDILFEEVKKYSSIFNFIETYNYGRSQLIKELLDSFLEKKHSPSKVFDSINLTIELLNLRLNPVVWFILICILPIDYFLAIKVEKFRISIRKDFPQWLNSFYKLEAFSSLATFSYLNPEYSFPQFELNKDLIYSKGLGHPLIKSEDRITNDFLVNKENKTNIITGSNMSGKSTFLRTVGINTLLAYAGSVVCAEKFIYSKYKLYTCIKVGDSVVDGISYFYAEVKRLKNIIDSIKADKNISFVLIDEIYKGTNNIERFVGSKAIIKYLSGQDIYSLISTHDLEMVNIAEELESVKNYHFKENIEDDKMYFNYKLLDGPCPTTNALKIMEKEGLPT